jgi:hypothetical protein
VSIEIFTRRLSGRRDAQFEACRASIAAAGVKHTVILDLPIIEATFEAIRICSEPYFAFVDDDDTIVPGAIEHCLDAMRDKDVAFTWSESDGRIYKRAEQKIEMAVRPDGIHHLAVVRRTAILEDDIAFARKIGWGCCWIFRAAPAIRGRVVKVPMVGYHYTRSVDGHSRSSEYADGRAAHASEVIRYLKSITTPEELQAFIPEAR